MAAVILVSESGKTLVSASTQSMPTYWSGETPVHRQSELKNSYCKSERGAHESKSVKCSDRRKREEGGKSLPRKSSFSRRT
jgi:hypothetical protein